MNALFAKIAGWAQFGLQLLGSFGQNGTPHGFFGWLTFAGSLAAAIGIHAASNVGQVQPAPTNSTVMVGSAHISQ